MSDSKENHINMEQEWSHFIDSHDIGAKAVKVEILMPQASFDALCNRLDLHSIENLTATLRLKRNSVNKVIHVEGIIKADIHQKCVVTAEPVLENIHDKFEAWFSDAHDAVSFEKARRERMSRREREDQPMLDEQDDPEPIIDNRIDLGELVVQHLSLALNPYPRKEGITYEKIEEELGKAPDGTYDNPFAALKNWKIKETKTE